MFNRKTMSNQFRYFTKTGAPIAHEFADINPRTVADQLYIGAHISWSNERCASDDYGLGLFAGSGIVFDIGASHFYVMTDYRLDDIVKMHFVKAFHLDCVLAQDIRILDPNVNDPLVVQYDIESKTIHLNNYSDFSLVRGSTTRLVSNSDTYKYPNTYAFIELGQVYDYFVHRNMHDKPMMIEVMKKDGRPPKLDVQPYKTALEKHFESLK